MTAPCTLPASFSTMILLIRIEGQCRRWAQSVLSTATQYRHPIRSFRWHVAVLTSLQLSCRHLLCDSQIQGLRNEWFFPKSRLCPPCLLALPGSVPAACQERASLHHHCPALGTRSSEFTVSIQRSVLVVALCWWSALLSSVQT